MGEHTIAIVEAGVHFECNSEESVIDAQRRAGLWAISSQCRSGGCGLCKVRIISGAYEVLPMSRAYISAHEIGAGMALACRIKPRSALLISVATGAQRFVWPA